MKMFVQAKDEDGKSLIDEKGHHLFHEIVDGKVIRTVTFSKALKALTEIEIPE